MPAHRSAPSVMRSLVLLLCPVLLALLGGSPALAAPKPAPPPSLTAAPTSGPAGSSTVLDGRHLPPRTSGTVAVGAASYAVRTSARGTFRLTATVPASAAPGDLVIVARVGAVSASTSFTVTEPAPPAGSAPRLRFGVSTPGGPTATAELDAVTETAGEAPSLVLSYADFTRELDVAGLEAVTERGAVPLVTWEPWAAGRGTDQPRYALDRIAAGDFDAYLQRWAVGLRDFGRPVLLRFAHEMNGSWYPWSEGVNGNGPGDYVAAWRHVRDVFAGVGTPQVSWVWSANVPYPGSVPLAGLYPGAAHVDVVALDGYNWGSSTSWGTWTSPAALFGTGLEQLRALAPGVPVMVTETASTELGGSKPDWIRQLIGYLAAQSDVTAVVWFDHLKETDWRLTSSPASASAIREALLARRTVT